MLSVGVCEARVVNHEWTTSQGGNPGLAIEVEVRDEWENHLLTGTIWFSPKAMGMARGQLREFGFDCDTQSPKEIGRSISFIGKLVQVTLEEQEYRGQKEIRISRFGGKPKPPSEDQLDQLGAALREAKKQPDSKPASRGRKAPVEYPDPNLQGAKPVDDFKPSPHAPPAEAPTAASNDGSDLPF